MIKLNDYGYECGTQQQQQQVIEINHFVNTNFKQLKNCCIIVCQNI